MSNTIDQLKKKRAELIKVRNDSGDLGTEQTQAKIDKIDKKIARAKPPANAYLDSLKAARDKAQSDYQNSQTPPNKSAKAIDPKFHLDSLKKRRAAVIESQKTSDDQQAIADADELENIDDSIKQVNAGMVWVESYMRGANRVNGYWRSAGSFSAPKTNYGLGLPKTAGTGTTR
jgi:Xaa-Pro aminopeptidase